METSFARALRLARAAEHAKQQAYPWWRHIDWRPGSTAAAVERPTEQAALARLYWQTRQASTAPALSRPCASSAEPTAFDADDTLRARLAKRGQTLVWLDLDSGRLTARPRAGARVYPVVIPQTRSSS